MGRDGGDVLFQLRKEWQVSCGIEQGLDVAFGTKEWQGAFQVEDAGFLDSLYRETLGVLLRTPRLRAHTLWLVLILGCRGFTHPLVLALVQGKL